ncbi:MAG: hypothetical protein K5917_02010 [Clostridiales bacterium]|nr:hypothetical protein [Clostridiales bacterium]
MDNENIARHQKKHKWAFPIGLIITLLSLVGIVTLVFLSVKGIQKLTDKSDKMEEYETFLAPVVMFDPDAFDDVTQANQSQLIDIAIWSLLKDENLDPDKYMSDAGYLIIPQDDVKAQLIALFGNDVKFTHQTIDGYGYQFVYDSASGVYQIPITGVAPIYTPKVVNATNKVNTIVLTVAYLPSDQWKQDARGNMEAPSANKYMKITLRKSAEGYYISALQATDAPETAATEATTQPTTTQVAETTAEETSSAETTTAAAE